MRDRASYAEGFSLGVEYAEHDRANGAACAAQSDEFRIEAREAREAGPSSWAAFKLGLVRGYRDVVRTFERGRWGA